MTAPNTSQAVPATKDIPIALAARTALTIDEAPTFRRAVTEFGQTDRPNHLKSLIEYVERIGAPETRIYRCSPLSMVPYHGVYGIEICNYRLPGTNLRHYSCVTQPVSEYWAPIASTTVPIDTLFSAIFQRAKTPRFFLRSPYAMRGEDLIVRYFTDTTLIVQNANDDKRTTMLLLDPIGHAPNAGVDLLGYGATHVAPPPVSPRTHKPKGWAIARKLADFLSVTLADLGAMTNIGRTTFSSWQTKNPRAATLIDLHRLDSLISALRSTIGDEKTRTWLHAGNPSPFSLLAANDLTTVENLASALIFKPITPSQSLAVSDYIIGDLPMANPYGAPIRAAKRAIRGRLTLDG